LRLRQGVIKLMLVVKNGIEKIESGGAGHEE